MKTDIQRDIYDETLRKFNAAAASGIAESGNENISDTFLEKIRRSNEIFSAFRTHRMQNEIAARLLDVRGRLKPFDRWKQDVKGITNHFVGPWLKTEYNTAVIRAHQAADWQHFVDEADVYPNVRWMPTTSPNQDPLHRHYWEKKLTLPVGDPFWNEHHPGDRWNCKCSLRQTDEPVNDSAIREFRPVPAQKGLENNPGKDGSLFSDSHSYFPKSCASCEFYRNANKGFNNRMKITFSNRQKDCNNCPYINGCLEGLKKRMPKDIAPPEVESYISHENGMVMESPYHGKNEVQENLRIARIISKETGKKVYLLPLLPPDTEEQLELRSKLMPKGIFGKKSPDFMIGGQFFEGKSIYKIEGNEINAIQNRIKKAKVQADNIILEIPDFVARNTFQDAIMNSLSLSKKDRTIIVIWRGRVLNYHNSRKVDK